MRTHRSASIIAAMQVTLITITAGGCIGEEVMDADEDEAIGVASEALSPAVDFTLHHLDQRPDGNSDLCAPAFGDIHGDGRPEVMSVCHGVHAWGSANGSISKLFSVPRASQAGNPANQDAVMADFNKDGRIDLAHSGDFGQPDLVIYLQQPDGSFAFAWASPNHSYDYTRSIEVGDFNGDSWPDVASVNTAFNGLVVFYNQGAAGWPPGTPFVRQSWDASAGGNLELAVGRFWHQGARDARDDVALHNGRIYIAGAGVPTTTLPVTGPGEASVDVKAADVDGDGSVDLAFLVNSTQPTASKLKIFRGTSSGFAAPTVHAIANLHGRRLVVGDFDRDPGKDFVVSVGESGGTFSYRLLRANGSTYDVEPLSLPLPAEVMPTQEPRRIEAADMNGDGVSDLAIGVEGYGSPLEATLLYLSQACTPGAIERVSVTSAGGQVSAEVYQPVLSAEGRRVAFTAEDSALVPGDTNGTYDVFYRDRWTGVTRRISVSSGGAQGNSYSLNPAISADGGLVAFSSGASNLVAGDSNGAGDVFVHHIATGATERVSLRADGAAPGAMVEPVSMSADGRLVAFMSSAALTSSACSGVYVRDRWSNVTTCEAFNKAGGPIAQGAWYPSLSPDGQHVTFFSNGADVVDGPTNGQFHVYRRHRSLGSNARVSVSSTGQAGNLASWMASMSASGRYVAFGSEATNLAPGGTGGVFVRDMDTGVTERVSVAQEGTPLDANTSERPSISADGRFVAFEASGGVFVRDRVNGVTTLVQANGSAPSLSADGRVVAFLSGSALVPGDTNGTTDVYVRTLSCP